MDEILNPNTIAYHANQVFCRYLDNLFAYVNGRSSISAEQLRPIDLAFMREIERHVGIDPGWVEWYRDNMVAFIGSLVAAGGSLKWTSNPRLRNAILKYLNVD